jgi:hypothetical protein
MEVLSFSSWRKAAAPLPGQTSDFLLNNSSIQASMEYKQSLPHIPHALFSHSKAQT